MKEETKKSYYLQYRYHKKLLNLGAKTTKAIGLDEKQKEFLKHHRSQKFKHQSSQYSINYFLHYVFNEFIIQ